MKSKSPAPAPQQPQPSVTPAPQQAAQPIQRTASNAEARDRAASNPSAALLAPSDEETTMQNARNQASLMG